MTLPLPRVGLLVNPSSGRGRGSVLGDRTERALVAAGHEVVDVSGETARQARQRAAEAIAERRIDVLAAVGGDGMAHLGANLCAGTDLPLAIVAGGSGNDNARALGLPIRQPEAMAALVTRGRTRSVDAGRCVAASGETRWWLGVLGGGFDSVVTSRAEQMSWPKGPMRYNLAMLRELPTFKAIPYVVVVDGHRIETEAMLVAVANGPCFGGGMRVAPGALYDDGLLDVMILHRISVPRFVSVFPKVFSGSHVDHPQVELLSGRQVRLEAQDIVTQADGERFEPLPIDVEVVPGALHVVSP